MKAILLLSLVTFSYGLAQEQNVQQLYPAKGHHLLGSSFEPLTNEPRLPIFKLQYKSKNLNLDHNGLEEVSE